jgi:hypothetical protein
VCFTGDPNLSMDKIVPVQYSDDVYKTPLPLDKEVGNVESVTDQEPHFR